MTMTAWREKRIEERTLKLLEEHLGLTPGFAKPEHRLTVDLGADSLDLLELVMGAEDEFGVEISDEEGEACLTAQDIINLVKSKGGE